MGMDTRVLIDLVVIKWCKKMLSDVDIDEV